jgi:spectrin alpha
LQGKVQKHQAFEAELSANQSRIDALQKSGQELLDGKHYAADEVSVRMDEVSSQWKKLLEATELKGEMSGSEAVIIMAPTILSLP